MVVMKMNYLHQNNVPPFLSRMNTIFPKTEVLMFYFEADLIAEGPTLATPSMPSLRHTFPML